MDINLSNLKESNDFLNVLFENITSAIFITDKELKVQSVNDTFLTLFGQKRELIEGMYCGNVIGCAFAYEAGAECGTTDYCNACTLRSTLYSTFLKQIPVYKQRLDRDFYINHKIEAKNLIFSSKYILFDGKEMVLVIIDDITEIEEKRKSLQKLNEEMNAILGMAAHDLRNPLSAIKSLSEIMIDGYTKLDENKILDFLGMIKEASGFSLNLLNELLDISKIHAGKLQLSPSSNDYSNLLQRIVKLSRYKAESKQIAIDLKLPFDDFEFYFDKNKIEQVLNNLIDNAIKYSFANTRISVSVSVENNHIITHITDEGQGIPQNELHNLFNPFQTTSVKSTAGEKSTGLGLAIVKKIVEGHRGSIWVDSTVGAGSTFSFKLPMVKKYTP